MGRVREWGRRLRWWWRRDEFERDLASEMDLHVELRAADKARDGLSVDRARTAARREFGNATRFREESRALWGWPILEALWKDLRYGARALLAAPTFSAAAVLSLTLGIGASTTIFSLTNAVLFRPLPVEEPDRLVQIQRDDGSQLTNPIWEFVRDNQDVFADVAAYSRARFQLTGVAENRIADGLWVSGDFFGVLGVQAERGRLIAPDDDRRSDGTAGPVVVLSHQFAGSLFGGDTAVVGRVVHLNQVPFTVVGVTPEKFTGLPADQGFDVAVPIGTAPLFPASAAVLDQRNYWWLVLVGRLHPGVSVEQAAQPLESLSIEAFRQTVPGTYDAEGQARYAEYRLQLGQLGTATGQQYRTALYVLMGLVGVVLVIACTNIANLLLSRASARRHELGLRAALGASRWRLLRQLMTESLLIACMGAVAGIALAQWGARVLLHLIETGRPLAVNLAPDVRVLMFAGGVTLFTAILFGLAPAFKATAGLDVALKHDARGSVRGSSRPRLGKLLILGQVALSLVLLVAAVLFVGTLRNLIGVDVGMRTDNLLLASTDLDQARIAPEARAPLRARMLERLTAVPGVVAAAHTMRPPVSQYLWQARAEPDTERAIPGVDLQVSLDVVSPNHFATVGTPLLRGRDFSPRDEVDSLPVTVIDQSAADAWFGADDPIGRTIEVNGAPREVIGVVADATYTSVTETERHRVYFSALQVPPPFGMVVFELRSAGSANSLVPAARAALAEAAPELAFEFESLEEHLDGTLVQPRLVALLASLFGALALLIAMVGLYGVTSYAVAERRGEIGVRMALGADRGSVAWLVLRDVIVLLGAGGIVGLAVALAAGRFIEALLYGVQPGNPGHLAVAVAILAGSATVAAWVPTRRAMLLDPVAALRKE